MADQYQHYEVERLVTPNVQALVLVINTPGSEVTVANCYRSPSASRSEDLELVSLLGRVAESSMRILILGDFNAPEVDWDCTTAPRGSFGELLLEFTLGKTLVQHVHHNTRWRVGQTSSILDLVVTKSPCEVEELEILEPLGRSGHGVIR